MTAGMLTPTRDRWKTWAQAWALTHHPRRGFLQPTEAVTGADLVITSVTFSPQLVPFLDARWVKSGAFATVTDLAAPWLPEGMSAFNRIVIDDLEQEAQMPKPLVSRDLVAGDLTGLVNGAIAGRQSDDETTAFVFRGLGLGDLAVAALAYQRAQASSARYRIDR